MSYALYFHTLTTNYDVKPDAIKRSDTVAMLAAALDAAYRARPSDYVIDARGLAEARRQAGTNAANLSLMMSRTSAQGKS